MLTVQHIEVIRRRNKMISPCNGEWYIDDDKILKDLQNPIKIPRVNIIDHNFLSKHPPPCDEIQYAAYGATKVRYGIIFFRYNIHKLLYLYILVCLSGIYR